MSIPQSLEPGGLGHAADSEIHPSVPQYANDCNMLGMILSTVIQEVGDLKQRFAQFENRVLIGADDYARRSTAAASEPAVQSLTELRNDIDALKKAAHMQTQHKSDTELHLDDLSNLDLSETDLRSSMAKLQSEVLEQRKLIESIKESLDKEGSEADHTPVLTPTTSSITLQTHEHRVLRTFQWGETVWEATIFVWLPRLGVWQSLSLMLAMLLNVGIQSYLCYILITSEEFGRSTRFDSDMRKWRITDGHNAKYVGTEDMSLATRVCGLDNSLSVAGSQVELLREINAYFSWDDPFDLQRPFAPTGPILCMVSISFFALVIIKEMSETFLFARALSSLPKGPTELKKGKHLSSVNPIRLSASLVLCGVRMAIAAILLYSGVLWLGDTGSIQDLILNSAALGFVMEIDELLFMTLARGRVTELVRRLDPIRSPQLPGLVEAVVPATMFMLVLFAAWYGVIMPYADNMHALKMEMCGGKLDFICDHQKDLRLIWSRNTQTYKEPRADMSALWSQAVEELRNRESAVSLSYPATISWVQDPTVTTQFSVHFTQRDMYESLVIHPSEVFAEQQACFDYDVLTGMSAWFNGIRVEAAAFSEQLGLPPVSFEGPFRCADFKGFCNVRFLDVLRLVCPVTCGCNDRASGLYVAAAIVGCPVSCLQVAAAKQQSMECVDTNMSSSVMNANWNTYWQAWKLTEIRVGGGWNDAKDEFHDGILSKGCDKELLISALTTPGLYINFCQGGHQVYVSIMALCPYICCNVLNTSLGCPMACSAIG